MTEIATSRLRRLNAHPLRPDGDYVLYWMVAFRRTRSNFAFDRAVAYARELDRPLVVLEPLRIDYPYASPRLHRFIIDGMAANEAALANSPVLYYPYVEPEVGAGKGLLQALAQRACVVVTDDYPCFFIPSMLQAAASAVDVALEAVDANGLLPLRMTDRVFQRAVDFRRFLHDQLPGLLDEGPRPDATSRAALPVLDAVPDRICEGWPRASKALLEGEAEALAALPLSHDVPIVPSRPGGQDAARRRLDAFLEHDLDAYGSRKRDLLEPAHSGLSPYLHFGHIGTHEILQAVFDREGIDRVQVDRKQRAKSTGFWRLSEPVESFLDELLTWRELGQNGATHMPHYTDYEGLPQWARQTLEEHEGDPREHQYDLATLEEARTDDALWNAAQRELLETGTIHSYLRMLWGKRILEWTPTPRQALEFMIALNDKYALDGRDPNSYSGIFWVLGRYDRPWGPERPVFGKVRYMTSESTRKKFPVNAYLERFAGL